MVFFKKALMHLIIYVLFCLGTELVVTPIIQPTIPTLNHVAQKDRKSFILV